jgi:beta-glucanase (GH16 family)
MKLRPASLVIVLAAAGLASIGSTATAANSSTHDPHPAKLARLSRLAWATGTFGPSNPSGVALPTAPVPGWRKVFADDFKGSSLNKRNWSTYDGQPGHDTGAWFASTHDLVRGGLLVISAYQDPAHGGRWVTGGLTHNVGQTYGRFLVRMRRDRGVGISHALVLWPINHIWPPEIDLSEDNATNQRTDYATLHYGTAQHHRGIYRHIAVDLTKWHTWGVEWMPGRLVYTLDSRVWATVASSGVPASPMRLCLQTQSWAAGVDRREGSTGPSTPRMVNMYVDWVVVYTRR